MKMVAQAAQQQQQSPVRQRVDSAVDGPEILQPRPMRPRDRRSLESMKARVEGLED